MLNRDEFEDLVKAAAKDWIQQNCPGLFHDVRWAPTQPNVLVVFLDCETESGKTIRAPAPIDMRENPQALGCRLASAVLEFAALTGAAMDAAKITISNEKLRSKYQDTIHSTLLCGVLDKAGKFAKAQGVSERDFRFWAEQAALNNFKASCPPA